MATASEWDEIEDYSKEELDEILRTNWRVWGERNDKLDIDLGGGGGEEVKEN